MIWLQGLALVGLVAVVVPLLLHFVAGRRTRRLAFPTVRFLGAPTFRSHARRLVDDWPLLLVRMATVACAAAAIAQPFYLSASRQDAARARDVVALVIDASASMRRPLARSSTPLVDEARARAAETASHAYRAERFEARSLADAVRRATRWLALAPPGRQRILIYTDAQAGALPAALLDDIPRHVGLDLIVLDPAHDIASDVGTRTIGPRGDRRVEHRTIAATTGDAPRVEVADATAAAASCALKVSVEAPPQLRDLADAVADAVVTMGVPCAAAGDPPLVIAFLDGPAAPRERVQPMTAPMLTLAARVDAALAPALAHRVAWTRRDDALVAAIDARPGDDAALRLVVEAFAAYRDPALAREAHPLRDDAAALARWRRAAGPVPRDAFRRDDASDARVLWAVVAALLALETWMRHVPRTRGDLDVA